MKKGLIGVSLAMAVLISQTGFADQLSGLVRVSGSAPFRQVTITKETEFSGPSVCPGDQAKRLVALESMVIKVWGTHQNKNGTECFDVGSFSVVKTPAGRPAVVGVLRKINEKYQLVTEGGKTLNIVDMPDALKNLGDKKVILDLKAVEAEGLVASGYSTVYYAEFP